MAGPFVVGRHSVVISAAPQRVFNYLADMARHEQWNGDEGFRTTIDTDGPPRAGFILHREKTGVMRGPLIIRGGMGDNPVRVVKRATITAYDPNYALAFETRNSYNGLLVSIDRMSFQLRQEAVGTEVSMLIEVEPMVPGGFMGPAYAMRVFRAAFERLVGQRLSRGLSAGPYLPRIKEMVEREEPAGMA